MLPNIDTIAGRVARRIERERALADDWRADAILQSEADNAGLTDPSAVAEVGARAAAILTHQARQAFTIRRAA